MEKEVQQDARSKKERKKEKTENESSSVRSRPTSNSGRKSSVHTQTGDSGVGSSYQKSLSRDPSGANTKGAQGKKKQKANYVTTLSRENQLKLNEAFLLLAETGENPRVEKSDVKKVFNLLGLHFNEDIVNKFCEVDEKDGDLKMNYFSFEKCVLQTMRTQPLYPKDIIKFYKKIDKLKEGQITFETLREWCYERDMVLPEDELHLMIRMADANKDSVISEEEFLRLMASTLPVSGQPRSGNK